MMKPRTFFCVVCLSLFTLTRVHLKSGTCSLNPCGRILQQLRSRETRAKRPKKPNKGKPNRFHCANCMVWTESKSRSKYCSDKCQVLTVWRTQKHRRRSRKRSGSSGESIDLPSLMKRDRGMCGICGKRVHRAKRYPHPFSPSVDHIIPLSRGGTNTWNNVQLSHHQCNQEKRSVVMGQLRIC